jgi:phosphoglycolate phosphatase
MAGSVLFDLDGTLIDSDEAIIWCVNELLARHGFKAASPKQIIPLIGVGLTPLLANFIDDPESYVPEYRLIYRQGFAARTRVYPGAVDSISEIRNNGIKVAIVTNRNARLADDIIKEKGLSVFIDALVGEDGNIALKPDPAMIYEACRILGTNPAESFMVGDTDIDIKTGRAAGCRTVFFTRGRMDEDPEADYTVSSLANLPEII